MQHLGTPKVAALRPLSGAYRRAREFAAANGASTAVEFAFTAPIFLLLSIGILYVGVTYMAKQYLESVAESAAYNVMVNNTSSTGSTQAAFQSYICSSLTSLFSCSQVMVDLEPEANVSNPYPTFTYNAAGNVTNTWNYVAPAPGVVEELRVMYPWPAISLPFGITFADMNGTSLLIMSVQVFVVEPN
jgi:Flp pilus assembly protein TadG